MSEIDTKLYDAMGQRFSVVKVIEQIHDRGIVHKYDITATPERYFEDAVIARNLKYSEAQGIVKLLGDSDG
jgi:hypothetical protein